MSKYLGVALTLCLHSMVTAQVSPNFQLKIDWLLNDQPYTARISRDVDQNSVVLDNGLVRRTIQLGPGSATVGFDNLMTGETIIRAIRPEAGVTIDGIRYPVGGLGGQPNLAYFTQECLGQLTSLPQALELVKVTEGATQERFAWKRTRHHAPGAKWPPAGVQLQLDYQVPQAVTMALTMAAISSDIGRACLAQDRFATRDNHWTIHTSESHPRSCFDNEGKIGEIFTPANTCVFAERELPPETRLVELTLDAGTDDSASWGPGLALVWPNRTLKFYLRPGGGADNPPGFGVWDEHREHIIIPHERDLDLSKTWTMRVRLEPMAIHCEAHPAGEPWQEVSKIPLPKAIESPTLVRIGKTSRTGGKDDFDGEKGELVRAKILEFAAYGPLDTDALQPQQHKNVLDGLTVSVHYELYDGIPALSKWLTVFNGTPRPVTLDRFTAEDLAVVEFDNPVETRDGAALARPDMLHVETDMAFSGFTHQNANRHTVHWRPDPDFTTQVNYRLQSPCHLMVEPTYGPAQTIAPGKSFESFRVFELVYDSTERERRGLALRRMYRTIAPWVTENPLMMHMRTAHEDALRQAIDQCAEVGFEMLILSFGSGFNAENNDPDYIRQWKEIADYAHSKGIQIGCYSLLSSRKVRDEDMIVSPSGQSPTHGQCPALASEWGLEYFRKLDALFENTGFDLLEHDGSYPGDVDTTPRPPWQRGIQDSRWVQWRIISQFYKSLRSRGVYMNVPDYYFLVGANKCGMGYRETNWSLPRIQQRIHTRQNIYDGSWTRTPSMGWMFVPLTAYHGGGAAATIEPLDQHLDHYQAMIQSNLGLGVQACYRGPRLFDTDRTKAMIQQQVAWFKKYRDILESDLVHGRRADGRDLDWMLHVNPNLPCKGLLAVFNPTDRAITREIRTSLYYTGLKERALVREKDETVKLIPLDELSRIIVPVTVPAQGFNWYVIYTER